ncbi:uncharacterized protein FOMMEDRAFT_165363 [Fomitiporia mediterranea MF3/22]|uniref:uncharacterized protein n=1 Tax=Fomitiporia mediterranea (strain MF3/22) TaxID=694068 RepID=UPI00044099F0|nr:uncharacterized protein FOMMEDRAFT_165363 [Fomitiporia mediterranea MF3/22]EJD06611.1 hypothetical protein FOMMEDRAFT_165363 [Fomitiporia mediterranea MF3/22]
MAPPKRHSTTRLPQSLLEEIDAQAGGSNGRRRNSAVRNRKAERKAERQLAKQRKAQFFSHASNEPVKKQVHEAKTNVEGPPRKKVKFQLTEGPQHGLRELSPLDETKIAEGGKKATDAKSKHSKAIVPKKPKDTDWSVERKRSRRDEEEDAYLEMLEKQLGIKKDKKGKSRYGGGFEDDGLLDLLVNLDEKVLGDVENEPEHSLDVSQSSDEAESSGSDDGGSSATDVSGEEEEQWTGFVSESEESDEEDMGMDEEVPPTKNVAEQNSNTQGSGSKYLPPQLREDASRKKQDNPEVDVKLTRQLKGLLNRLSEQNIDSILKEIENLYRSHRRHDITLTLTNLIIEGTCSHSILLDAYVALHAGLVACLHKVIGVEIAAYFVQNVVANFERHYSKSKESLVPGGSAEGEVKDEEIGKECSNLLVLLSDLYNYHVISCVLVYDIIRLILEGGLSELDVELILKLARGSGSQLRQDDPSALKDIIQIVHAKLGGQRNTSSRTRFMVETLNNLKNNKMKKAAAGAQGGNESKERISKFVAGIGKKYHVHAHEPLRISLDDLRQADSKGKWWLVGAAWGGDPLVDHQASLDHSSDKTVPAEADNMLLKLARKQGMNTDVRRSIFVVLMSSDDYVDACDRLAQLNLTEVQQREIIRVLIHCCGNEKSYNPYYTLIASHLCQQSHSHRVTLQYCSWDFLRSLGETNVGGAEMAKNLDDADGGEKEGFELDRVSSTRMANVARMYAWLVVKECVAITILKTLDFISFKSKTKIFLKVFFTHLFADSQNPSTVPSLSTDIDPTIVGRRDEKALTDMFVKATRVPALALGISRFLTSTFCSLDDESEGRDKTGAFMRWCCEVAKNVLHSAHDDL